MTTAFATASTAWFSGYPALKQRMYDRMVKAKGYNTKLVGPELEKDLWRRIDDYWIACFEARFQQELLRENRIGRRFGSTRTCGRGRTGRPWYLRDHIRDQLARNDCQSFPGARIVRPFQENGVDAGLVALDTSNNTYPMWAVAFAKGDYYAEVEFHGPPPSEIDRRRAEDARRIREERFGSYCCDAPPLEQMALYFARVVASKIPARR